MIPKISLFASSVREHAYEGFFTSLENQKVDLEVVFAGPCKPQKEWPGLKYIETGNVKPSQAYEIARRACTGELIHWTADDARYKPGLLDEAYNHWQELGFRKLVFSLQTWEYGIFNDMNVHHFYGLVPKTPLMAPLGLMNREYLEELGGIDKRFLCGQWENDVVMRVYADGGLCEIFGNHDLLVFMDHENNHGKGAGVHFDRPFAKGYEWDRKILEELWTETTRPLKHGMNWREVIDSLNRGFLKIREKRLDDVQKFEDTDILTKSQSEKGQWE